MNDQEQAIASAIYTACMESMHATDRASQAQQFRVGVSDLGFCSERLRRFLDREEPKEIDMLPAFIGTWLGEGIEQAVAKANPRLRIQSELMIRLDGDQGTYFIPGHPDIIDSDENVLIDVKSTYGLELARRTGFDDQQKRFQRHCYAFGAICEGWLSPDCQVGNLWIDRAGQDREFHVQLEPFDMAVVNEATQWLDQVIYSWTNGETAQKEPPREMCAKACGFFQECRMFDSDVEGLLTDPEVVSAAALYKEAATMETKAKQLKEQAKGALTGVAGSTGQYLVRWVRVGESHVDYVRSAYERLSITKMKN